MHCFKTLTNVFQQCLVAPVFANAFSFIWKLFDIRDRRTVLSHYVCCQNLCWAAQLKPYIANYYHMPLIPSNGKLIGSDSPFSKCWIPKENSNVWPNITFHQSCSADCKTNIKHRMLMVFYYAVPKLMCTDERCTWAKGFSKVLRN